jgi:hypothetical protein
VNLGRGTAEPYQQPAESVTLTRIRHDQSALTRWSIDFNFAFTTGRTEAGVRFAATVGAARIVPCVVDGLDNTKGELSPISP